MATLTNDFSWSASRDTLFEECKRKYYYNYYGSWGGWEKDRADNVTRTLYVLKNLQNIPMWKGKAVHTEIARILKELVTTNELIGPEYSLARVTNLMRQDFKFSRAGLYWNTYESLGKANYLFEHEYGLDISDERWKKNHQEVITCIRNFYKSDILEKVINLGYDDILSIDRIAPIPFSFNEEKIYVNLDLAYKLDDEIEIVDWKTGSGESNKLQFIIYTIYANEILHVPADKISLIEYNLFGNEKTIHRFRHEELSEAKNYINSSINSMKSYLSNPIENEAVITDFPRIDDEWKCNSCNFKKICFDLP
jgi:hypothetical protein